MFLDVLFFIVTLSIKQELAQYIEHKPGYCAFTTNCVSPIADKIHTPCVNNRHAKSLNNAHVKEELKQLCPTLFQDTHDPELCCHAVDVMSLVNAMEFPIRAFERCPSCLHNFLQLWCRFICSANQSLFVNIDEASSFIENETNKSEIVINNMTLYIDNEFGVGLFNSCSNVDFPGANFKSIEMFCEDRENCTVHDFYAYIGSTRNGYVSAHTNITLSLNDSSLNNSMIPLHGTIFSCSDSINSQRKPCDCADCRASCPALSRFPLTSGPFWQFVNYEALIFYLSMIFALIASSFLLYQLLNNIISKKNQEFLESADISQEFSTGNEDDDTISNAFSLSGLLSTSFQERRIKCRLEQLCFWWAVKVINYPIIAFFTAAYVVCFCSVGLRWFTINDDPVSFLSDPYDNAYKEMQTFNGIFTPVPRTEQIIISTQNPNGQWIRPNLGDPVYFGPVFNHSILLQIFQLENDIRSLTVDFNGKTVTLQDVCFSLINHTCAFSSPFNWWQDNLDNLSDISQYSSHFLSCANRPEQSDDGTAQHQSCLSTWGSPTFPSVVLGGYPDKNYQNSTALIITFTVIDQPDLKLRTAVEAWEAKYLSFLANYSNPNLTIAYSAGRSITDEIENHSFPDPHIVAISYSIMFLYIILFLGRWNCSTAILVNSKIVVGATAILLIACSVVSGVGVMGWSHIPTTMIALQIVPMLVLAIGVDNVFIFVQRYQRYIPSSIEEPDSLGVAITFGKIGPGILMTCFAEISAFLLGTFSSIPAAKSFSICASCAIAVNFFLQITVLMVVLNIDVNRQRQGFFDVFCCIKAVVPPLTNVRLYTYNFFYYYFAPFILSPVVRCLVLVSFGSLFFTSCCLATKVSLGLEPISSVPKNSYLYNYFNTVQKFSRVGPPLYFVVSEPLDYSNNTIQNKVCRSMECDDYSITHLIASAAMQSNISYMMNPPSSWLDAFFDWLDANRNPLCCREFESNGSFCSSTVFEVDCRSCLSINRSGMRPTEEEFWKFIPWFLNDIPTSNCFTGDRALIRHAVSFNVSSNVIQASYFSTYHTLLKNSSDSVNAINQALFLAKNITRNLNEDVKVFPYSHFYIYYEQYLSLWSDAIFNISLCLIAIFFIALGFLGFNVLLAAIIVIVIFMIVVNLLAFMYIFNITLNAISLVNILMGIGISMEFCGNMVREFLSTKAATSRIRAIITLKEIGSSIFSGIFLTKFLGILVLAFSQSQIFQKFYFLMYFGIIVLAALHGLIFLPALLSFVGNGGYRK